MDIWHSIELTNCSQRRNFSPLVVFPLFVACILVHSSIKTLFHRNELQSERACLIRCVFLGELENMITLNKKKEVRLRPLLEGMNQ